MPHSVSETQETPYSWFRMLVGMAICSIGGVGMWSVVVALPAVQAEFGSARSGASLPYTLVMLGIAAGGVLMGRMADKKGIVPPMLFGAVSLCAGYVLSGFATSLWQFAILHGVLIGAIMQGLSLTLFLFFDSLSSLYVISAMFGLFQGGIVPTYAIIVREYFPAGEAGTRVGLVFMATLIGMALGGWVSGAIFDLSGSYALAFLNGVLWNLVNVAIIGTLLLRGGGPLAVFRARTIAATARA